MLGAWGLLRRELEVDELLENRLQLHTKMRYVRNWRVRAHELCPHKPGVKESIFDTYRGE